MVWPLYYNDENINGRLIYQKHFTWNKGKNKRQHDVYKFSMITNSSLYGSYCILSQSNQDLLIGRCIKSELLNIKHSSHQISKSVYDDYTIFIEASDIIFYTLFLFIFRTGRGRKVLKITGMCATFQYDHDSLFLNWKLICWNFCRNIFSQSKDYIACLF